MAPSIPKNLLRLLFAGLVVVTIVVFIRTFTLAQRSVAAPPCKPLDTDFIKGDKELISRFQRALTFKTISRAPHDYNPDELQQIQEFITKSYPTIHSSPLVTREVVAKYSLLYTVQGSDTSLKPYMLTGHLDVVPVITDEEWEAPPFEGGMYKGFIYGRGALDDKHTVFGILEALEFLLKRGHKPVRSFYLGFGHDEEVGGDEGAYNIAQTLISRNVQVEYLLDEGMTIMNGAVPGMSKPVALVGSSEKGRVTVRLSVQTAGGHSSMPSKESSIGILSQAITRLEANPHPSMFGTGPEKGTFEHLAPDMAFGHRVIMSNLWLFSPLVARVLSNQPGTNAIARTTTAVTKFHAGIKDNVLAPYAEATVNHRIHPSQTVQEVFDYDKQIINDERVQLTITDSMEPLPKSPYGGENFGWQMIKTSIKQVWDYAGTVVAPTVMIGNTDTRHYTQITRNLYRFSPTFMYPDDLARFHGVNERLSPKNFEEAVNFFYHLMINSDNKKLEPMHMHGEF